MNPELIKSRQIVSNQEELVGDHQIRHNPSKEETTATIASKLNKMAERLQDQTVTLAVRSKEAREFLDFHTDHVRAAWMDWLDESSKVLESIRQTRVAIGFESKQLLSECGEVRKFFLSDDHNKEIAKLREFIDLAERLRALKQDGTLDKLADTILKLA